MDEFVSHSNLKLQSILADLEDKRILTIISVLSFFHVCITEPYWQLMNSTKSYADFPLYVKKMKSIFDNWGSSDFQPVGECVESGFGEEFAACLSDINVVKEFLGSESLIVHAFKSCFRKILEHSTDALKRQLVDFLEGGTFGGDLADDVRKILQTCPLTNLTGERLFGDLDYCSASSLQSPSLTRKLMERAIKYGPECKLKSLKEKKDVNERIQSRITENKRKKDEQTIKLAERRSAALDAISAGGGCLVSTKEQLDELYHGPRAVDKMKDQIRFRSLIRGENITIKKALYERLLAHITSTTSTR